MVLIIIDDRWIKYPLKALIGQTVTTTIRYTVNLLAQVSVSYQLDAMTLSLVSNVIDPERLSVKCYCNKQINLKHFNTICKQILLSTIVY